MVEFTYQIVDIFLLEQLLSPNETTFHALTSCVHVIDLGGKDERGEGVAWVWYWLRLRWFLVVCGECGWNDQRLEAVQSRSKWVARIRWFTRG